MTTKLQALETAAKLQAAIDQFNRSEKPKASYFGSIDRMTDLGILTPEEARHAVKLVAEYREAKALEQYKTRLALLIAVSLRYAA